jgi:hypothetical protein
MKPPAFGGYLSVRVALAALIAVFIIAILALLWQPIAALAQSAIRTLENQLFLPIVIQSEDHPSPTPTEPTPTEPSPSPTPTEPVSTPGPPPELGSYVVIGWNDLGMHCYNRDFSDLAVLPPWNTLWAQVIQRGDPPVIVTEGITVTFGFQNNTYSVGKSNFWEYDVPLFGVDLPENVGLSGTGLSGAMHPDGDHFIAEGIPLTEYDDDDHENRQPYQLADLVVIDSAGTVLATNQVVAPVSTEMHCDYCHYDNGPGNEDIATGIIEQNILTYHDEENMEEYPPGHEGPLMSRRPILCAECHATNALGAPGVAGIPNLSKAMHEKHAGISPDSTSGCYNCHPGPQTQCLRDVMSDVYGLQCTNCHGGMEQVKENPNPWLNEPRCDTCHHEPGYEQDQPLYRFSKGHGGMYCEACHDSTHAVAPSTQPRDAIKFINLQGHIGELDTCIVCHLTDPVEGGPH